MTVGELAARDRAGVETAARAEGDRIEPRSALPPGGLTPPAAVRAADRDRLR
ncbi:copper homeostasis protein CutC [Streptosporangium becharense]|uniref:Copper homeostasis protein CutC n=1 Tax=Streptosporangium becharense TaxID=1816182 RepID=A0A7W9MJX8_9ACTN|nr:copper homeostasis protein CutC [Streptosporangium becharense]MBB5823018.1 copper homeostasis protein CutC [Streptosporangium becharense]